VANDKTRELLTPVPQILREAGHPERAEALEAVLAPGGWKALEEASEKSPKTQNLSRLVAEGYEAVLDGSWEPPAPAGPRPMAPGDSRVILNVTLENALRERLRAEFGPLKDRLGYKVTEGGTAVAYLRHRLGITDEVLDSYVKRLAP
jgi:hypothetical protein